MTYRAMSRIGLVVAASLLMTAPALAGDGYGNREGRHGDHHNHRPQQGSWGPGLPSVAPGIGTFAGNISAVRIRGNGIYFASSGSGGTTYGRSGHTGFQAPRAKIIHVNAVTAKSACAWEAGVCVIRP